MTTKKKLKLGELQVKSFVTADRHALRGGECSDECFFDPSCAGAGCGGVGGSINCSDNCGSNPCGTGYSDCDCPTLPGLNCPSQIGQLICAN